MNRINEQLAVGNTLQRKIGEVFRQRVYGARDRYQSRLTEAFGTHVGALTASPDRLAALGTGTGDYLTDVAQRSLIFWDTLRQRGNQFVAHQKAGLPPVLHFDYETILDARTFELQLSQPFGMVLECFAKAVSSVLFVMPKRIAETDAFTAITDPVGSGPFRMVRGEWDPGAKVVYEKFAGYVPRAEPASAFAGGKVVHVDRVEWISMRDQQAALGALQTGQIDYWEAPLMDLLATLQRNRSLRTRVTNTLGTQGQIYFNHVQPPFDHVKARQAMFWLAKQEDYLQAVNGNPQYFRTCPSFFACGTPMENDVDAEPLEEPNQLGFVVLGSFGGEIGDVQGARDDGGRRRLPLEQLGNGGVDLRGDAEADPLAHRVLDEPEHLTGEAAGRRLVDAQVRLEGIDDVHRGEGSLARLSPE